jgi:CheY-like chemotaxis protein
MRLSVRLLLEGRHKELVVREAVDGVDAIEKAKQSKPDLILLDLAMPRLNGAGAAAVLKERYAGSASHPIYVDRAACW